MNRFIPFFLFVSIVLLMVACSSAKTNFYVSPSGDDENSGSKLDPFLTIEKAKEALQQSIEKDCAEDRTIWLADGYYEIEKPIVFDATDFGTRVCKISIKAENEANPVISGGKLVKSWTKNEDGLWVANLKIDKAPRELFIEGNRAIRARFPNDDYLRVKKVGDDRRTHFYFDENEFPLPQKVKDVELVLLHDWSISRIAVKEIDTEKNKLTAVDSIGAKKPEFFNLDHWEQNPRYFLENDLAFLDADYEWYFDGDKGKVFLKLPESQTPDFLQIVVPVSEGLIQIAGAENATLKNISFEGITFQHCAWQIPEMGYCGVQACHFDSRPVKQGWSVVPAAVGVEWAENISFNNCAFENLGTSGLWFSTGCKNCSVSNSDFIDIAGNGIMIGEGRDRLSDGKVWWQEVPEQVATGNTIENCSVTECGTQFYGAVGIWCGLTAETTIRNNTIFKLPYTGISIGWMWSPVPTPCRDNSIDGNHIHHILNTLSDGGGIYMLGLQPGSKLINNHIHDVKINAGRAESNGMFLDEGTTDVVVANNLIYNIAKSPLRFHKATTNLVKENYLFCTNENPPIRYNRTNEEDIEQVDNKVFNESDLNYSSELKSAINKILNGTLFDE
ncbi:right-handed parallel beta-helix repeat-containing protein [Prolixibacteraceae bacterium Z1-6]|uniref:Right-handed parallel beta-helix repeat-containing protein n=1 Tax=Draconibacterium aestuarii TaxID=2998507 RepID=A0A9X3J8A8_9BACT|nr:right-handed parallel beta-helix repeat-containing protein [Prolixibacteraceae bacterium Z1-6]